MIYLNLDMVDSNILMELFMLETGSYLMARKLSTAKARSLSLVQHPMNLVMRSMKVIG